MKKANAYHLILPAAVALTLLCAPRAAADPSVPSAISRTLEPVIVRGHVLPAYLGAPVTQIFVFAFSGGSWTQLPAQVDEVDTGGSYVAWEDGLLDDNDEIVLMARDLGEPSGGAPPTSSGGKFVASWYELTVTDPTHPANQGWAYVVRSPLIQPVLTSDYVAFNASNHRIIGRSYTLGFASPRPWLDYLALGRSGVDLLDRSPKYRYCRGALCLNENLAPDTPDSLIKDGPVRAILRNGRMVAYGWMALSIVPLTIPPSLAPDFLRFSTDFNASAVGATFYNAAVPEGVRVDGSPDTVPATPFSSWAQLSHSTGTLILVYDATDMGGTTTNYYVDSSETDTQDTSDKRHYGDAGLRVDYPNLSFTFKTTLYFLAGAQDSLGQTYAGYAAQPLQRAVQWQQLALTPRQYLPVVHR